MKCIKCGLNVSENSKFCGYCGAPVEKINTEQDLLSAIDKAIGEVINIDKEDVVNSTIDTDSTEVANEITNINEEVKEFVEPVEPLKDEDASVQTIIDIIKSDTPNNNVENIERVAQQIEQLNNNTVEMPQTLESVESVKPVDLVVPVQPIDINASVLPEQTEEKIDDQIETSGVKEHIEIGADSSEYKEETDIFIKPVEYEETVVSNVEINNEVEIDEEKQEYPQEAEEYVVPIVPKEEKENNENLEINNLENVNGGVFADKKEEIGKNNEYLEEKNSQNITSDVPVAKNVEKENKKGMSDKDKRLAIIIGGAVAFLIIQVLLIMLIITATNKSSGSIEVLKRSVSNLQSSSEQSGTINTKILVENTNNDVVNLSAVLKYAKVNGAYDVAMTLNKSLINDEINLYSKITDSEFNLYVDSSVFDMLGLTSSNENKWLQYTMNVSNNEKSNKELIDEIDGKYVKYIGSDDGSEHYQLTVDKKLVEYIKSKLLLNEQSVFGNLFNLENIENYVVDFYLNENNELEKISIDLTDIYALENISKIVVSFEFSDLNNTIVIIPEEALNGQTNLIDYINSNKTIAQ